MAREEQRRKLNKETLTKARERLEADTAGILRATR